MVKSIFFPMIYLFCPYICFSFFHFHYLQKKKKHCAFMPVCNVQSVDRNVTLNVSTLAKIKTNQQKKPKTISSRAGSSSLPCTLLSYTPVVQPLSENVSGEVLHVLKHSCTHATFPFFSLWTGQYVCTAHPCCCRACWFP